MASGQLLWSTASASVVLLDMKEFFPSNKLVIKKYIEEGRQYGEADITDIIVNTYGNNITAKTRRITKFGNNKDNYIYGAPVSSKGENNEGEIISKSLDYINSIEGSVASIFKTSLTSKNPYFNVWEILYGQYGYNHINNELEEISIGKGTECYLVNVEVRLKNEVVDILTLNNNTKNTSLPFNYGKCFEREVNVNRVPRDIIIGLINEIEIEYAFNEVIGTDELGEDITVVKMERVINSLDDYAVEAIKYKDSPTHNWVQMVYRVDSYYKIFVYLHKSGGIPSIDEGGELIITSGTLAPRIYLRDQGTDIIKLSDEDKRKKDIIKILRILGIKLIDIDKAIHEGIESIDSTYKYIYLDYLADLKSSVNDSAIAEYLYYFFDSMYASSQPLNPGDYLESINLGGRRKGLKVEYDDGNVKNIVEITASGKSIQSGVVTNSAGEKLEVGEYCSNSYPYTYTVLQGRGTIHTTMYEFKYQTTTDRYITLSVVNPVTDMRFFTEGLNVSATGYRSIPILSTFLNRLNINEREILLNKCLKINVLAFTRYEEPPKKWYETGIFKAVMAIISVGINYAVPGLGSSLSGIISAATQVVVSVAVDLAINALVKVAVKLGLSIEVASIIGALGTIALTGISNGTHGNKLINARDVMYAINSSFNTYEKRIGIEIENTKKASKDFIEGSKEKIESLKAAQDLLNTGVSASSYLLAGYDNTPTYLEDTNAFYTKTAYVDVSEITTEIVATAMYEVLNPTVTAFFPRPLTEDIEDALLIK